MKAKLMAMILAAGAALGAWAANVRVYVHVADDAEWYANIYFYSWDGTATIFDSWPGLASTGTDVKGGLIWHYLDIDATAEEFPLIINDGGTHKQTEDFAITDVIDGKSYFIEVVETANANGHYICQLVDAEDLGNSTTVTIGSCEQTNYHIPVNGYYNYSLSQQIYTADEIGMAGSIRSIAFLNANSNAVKQTCSLDVYLSHTGKETYSGDTDWISASQEDVVFSGAVTFLPGEWTAITFDKPFDYNGTDNLVITVDNNTGSYVSSLNLRFAQFETSGCQALRQYSDSYNVDVNNVATYGGRATSQLKNHIKLEISSSTPEASVEQLIAAIGEVSYTDGSKAKIDAARAAYNALTTAQRALVANYATLTAAETTYAALKAAADAAVADAAAAAAVIDAIAAIGEVAYTDESKAKIDAARAAYNALTTAQRALVTNYATLTAAEAAYAALVPAPCYEVIDEADITEPYAAAKAVTLKGAAYDGCDVVGIVELKLGKVNAKKKTSKVSGSVTTLDGKKHAAKGVTVTGIDGTAPATVSLTVKDLGTMAVTIGGAQFAGTLGGTYHVQSASVGGAWAGSTATATVEVNNGDLDKFPGTLLTTLLPDEETATVKNSKWTFAKAATVKWAKPKKGAAKPEIYDEASDKGLIIDDSKGKTNLSGLKLTYTPKKGTFKGSFKVYALEGTGKAIKLKKYTFNVSGFVLDGVGYGKATCKKPSVSWSLTVE